MTPLRDGTMRASTDSVLLANCDLQHAQLVDGGRIAGIAGGLAHTLAMDSSINGSNRPWAGPLLLAQGQH